MLEKRNAKKVYGQLVDDLRRYKETMQKSEFYDGFDRGYIILPKSKVTINFTEHLFSLAAQDAYHLKLHPVKNISTGAEDVMIVIDNESEEFKARRKTRIEEQANLTIDEGGEKPKRMVYQYESYINKKED